MNQISNRKKTELFLSFETINGPLNGIKPQKSSWIGVRN